MSEKKDPSKSPRYTNGPVVKTGPTAGQNRSRNDDGAWRRKRNDAGDSKKSSKCFISTAACQHKGLPDNCRELETLRHFRDDYLLGSAEGRALVAHYYSIAPAVAERLIDPNELEQVWKVISRCIRAIEARKFESATKTYQAMVLRLAQKYAIGAD
jgi:hypothetical protein